MQQLFFVCLLLFASQVVDIDGYSDSSVGSRQLTASKHTPKPKPKKHTPRPKPKKHTPKPKPKKHTPKPKPSPPCKPGSYKGTCCDSKCKCRGATCNAIVSESICNYNVQINVCTAAVISAGGQCTPKFLSQINDAISEIHAEFDKTMQVYNKDGCRSPDPFPGYTNAYGYCEKQGYCEK